MVKILWLSRHAPTPEQREVLTGKFGDLEIVQEAVTVASGAEVLALKAEHGCSEVMAVLPPNLLGEIIRGGCKPFRAVMSRKETGEIRVNPDTGKEEKVFQAIFERFERVVEVVVKTEPL